MAYDFELLEPLPATDVSFGVADLTRASQMAHSDPGSLTDKQIRMLASYSRDEAAVAVRARTKALASSPSAAAPRRVRDSGVVTVAQFNAFITETLAPILKELLAQRDVRLDEQQIHARALAEKVFALEQRPSFDDRGVWSETESYKHLAGVTHDGGFWLAQRATTRGEKPGSSSAWRLAVRRGKQGPAGQDLR